MMPRSFPLRPRRRLRAAGIAVALAVLALAMLWCTGDASAPGRWVSHLHRLPQSAGPSQPAARLAAVAAPTELAPPDAHLANRGTPEACLQTIIAATEHSDVEGLARSITLSPESERAVGAFLQRLPASEREKYRPPEKLVALLWTNVWCGEGELSQCRVVDLGAQDGAVTFGLDWVYASGRIRRSRMTLVSREGAWRQQVSATFVDGLIAENLRPASATTR